MRRILLTSSGFETAGIMRIFHDLLGKPPAEARALFVPTAAIHPGGVDGIGVLPKCLNDLLRAGIPPENIGGFDLHRNMTADELDVYDVIYFTGGDPAYLLERINDTGFSESLNEYVSGRGVYVGVSAGSIVAARNLPGGLGYINCTLGVHMRTGTPCGPVDQAQCPHIDLTAENVIIVRGDVCEIAE